MQIKKTYEEGVKNEQHFLIGLANVSIIVLRSISFVKDVLRSQLLLTIENHRELPICSRCTLSLPLKNIRKPYGFLMFLGGRDSVHWQVAFDWSEVIKYVHSRNHSALNIPSVFKSKWRKTPACIFTLKFTQIKKPIFCNKNKRIFFRCTQNNICGLLFDLS